MESSQIQINATYQKPLYSAVAALVVLIFASSGFIHFCELGYKAVEFGTPLLFALLGAVTYLKAKTTRHAIILTVAICIISFLLGEFYSYYVHENKVGLNYNAGRP